MNLFLLTIVSLSFSSTFAQISGVLPFERAVPIFRPDQKETQSKKNFVSEKTMSTAYNLKDIQRLAQELKNQYQTALLPLSEEAPICASSKAPEYVRALQTSGQFDRCIHFVQTCLQNKTAISPVVFTTAALCEGTRFNTPAAIELFELGIASDWKTQDLQREHIHLYATYLLSNGYETQVDRVLQHYPGVDGQQLKIIKAVIKRFLRSNLDGFKKEEVDKQLEKMIANAKDSYRSLLLAIQTRISQLDYKYSLALESLFKNAKSFNNPLLWYDLAYDTLYYGLNQNFAWAREIYDVADLYSHPWQNFPVEANTYNYTEIYNQVCKNNLSQGNERVSLDLIKGDLREGRLTNQSALLKVLEHERQNPGRADVLTLKAGLLSVQGNLDEAMQNFWQAHHLCRYYNRANWGLTLLKRATKYKFLPDYQENLERMNQRLAATSVPQEVFKYFINWNSLDSESRRRVTYGGWIWMPFIPHLLDNNMKTYLKYSFELLSESPGLADIRDERIGGVQYPNDNRLWDDVRGLGGNPVVADLTEVFQTPQGDYNLLGHEMAHQFQFLMDVKFPRGVQCIEELYQEAVSKKNFPDGYSSYNREEHFAQGVTYYLVPEESSSHFGLNRSWLVTNNSRQFKFIQSIENSKGQFSQIGCETKSTP